MRKAIWCCAALMVALSLASVAAASAHEYYTSQEKLGSGSVEELKENKEEAQTQELLGTPFGVATHVNCSLVVTTGKIEGTSKGNATLKFTKCTVTKPANCTVKEPIETNVTTALVGTSPEVEFKPEGGTTFTTITLLGASCSIKEPFTVTGTQTCKLPSSETEKMAHEIACETTGSNLKAGGKTATFKGGTEGLELAKEYEWSVDWNKVLPVWIGTPFYRANSLVRENGICFRARVENQNRLPEANPTQWQLEPSC
jgi:hypothetical protein